MKYDIQEAVDFITSGEKPATFRAVELFALIVALHAGTSEAKITGHQASNQEDSLILNVDQKLLKDAKLLAAMKLLDHIESEWSASHPGEKPTIQAMAQIYEYSQLYNEVILEHGGWKRIRFSDGIRNLEANVAELKPKAKDVSGIIEFSVRVSLNPKKPRQKGGVTMAIHILATKSGKDYFRTRTKKSQLEVNWAHFKAAAPFFYLLYVRKYQFFLKGIAGKKFATKWLKRVEDRKELLHFFAAYNAVVAHLKNRNYIYTPLCLPSDAAPVTIDFGKIDPLDGQKVLGAIDRYRT